MRKKVNKKLAILDSAEMKRVNGGTNLMSLPIIGPIIGVIKKQKLLDKLTE